MRPGGHEVLLALAGAVAGYLFRGGRSWRHEEDRGRSIAAIEAECGAGSSSVGSHDATERQALERRYAEVARSEERFRTLASTASHMVLVIDADNAVTYASSSVEWVCGHTEAALTGASLTQCVMPDDAAKLALALHTVRAEPGRALNVNFRVPDADGRVRYIEAALSDLSSEPSVNGVVLNGRDVSERESLEEDLRHAAYRDPLTGLPNRASFNGHLETTWPRADESNVTLALLLIDLDRFNLVNDSRGHAAGDEMLVRTASRLRELSPAGGFLARLGGDEFALVVRGTEPEFPMELARQIVEAFETTKDGVPSVSVGVATPGVGRNTPGDLVRAADLALYDAKRGGRGGYTLFDPNHSSLWIERLELEEDLRNSVIRGELRLLYQPIVDMTTRRLVASEALVRWDHPTRGTISPAVFIPLAEESGMIAEIGEWVLHEAIRQIAEWEPRFAADGDDEGMSYVSVNVSAAELRDPLYAERVGQALREAGVQPQHLQLELTETLLADDGHGLIQRLEDLKAQGIRLAIDDFGTGYSSLSYLSRMPVDVMKVDRSFVSGMQTSDRVESVVRATMSLAQALDLKVVAEGVETLEQQEKLLTLGETLGQGFFFERPIPPDELEQLFGQQLSIPPADSIAEPDAA